MPGRVTARMAAGTNGLLRDGAVPVTSTEDVLDELYGVGLRPEPAARAGGPPHLDGSLRAVLDAVEAGAGVDEIVPAHPFLGGRGAGRAGSPRGGGARRARRARRVGAGRHVSARDIRAGSPRAAYPPGPMVPDAHTPPRLLSIAGSDSGGGAGIQADLKAFAACGAHGMTAITAITAQNTLSVSAVYPLPPRAIVEQVRAVVEDIGVDAVKIGMVGTAESIEAVARALDLLPADVPVVLDPVMVAESGGRLLEPDAERSLRERLVPRATVVTPNVMEAAALAGLDASADAGDLARGVYALGPPRWWSPEVTARRAATCSTTASGSWRSRASAIPTGPPTGRAAPTRPCWRRTLRWGSTRSRRRAARRSWRRPRSRAGCAASAAGRVRSTCSASAHAGPADGPWRAAQRPAALIRAASPVA